MSRPRTFTIAAMLLFALSLISGGLEVPNLMLGTDASSQFEGGGGPPFPLVLLNSEAIFSAAIAGRMMRFFDQRPAAPQVAFPEISESERRVLHRARTTRPSPTASRSALRRFGMMGSHLAEQRLFLSLCAQAPPRPDALVEVACVRTLPGRSRICRAYLASSTSSTRTLNPSRSFDVARSPRWNTPCSV